MGQQEGLNPFEQLGGRVVIALDGVEYFCSQKLGSKQCSRRKHSNGKTDNFHSMHIGYDHGSPDKTWCCR